MKNVKIYTTNYCPYCTAAKKLLTAKSVSFDEINVENDTEKRAWLVQTTGQRTVPQIFIDEKPIGGFSELSTLDQEGKLDKILNLK